MKFLLKLVVLFLICIFFSCVSNKRPPGNRGSLSDALDKAQKEDPNDRVIKNEDSDLDLPNHENDKRNYDFDEYFPDFDDGTKDIEEPKDEIEITVVDKTEEDSNSQDDETNDDSNEDIIYGLYKDSGLLGWGLGLGFIPSDTLEDFININFHGGFVNDNNTFSLLSLEIAIVNTSNAGFSNNKVGGFEIGYKYNKNLMDFKNRLYMGIIFNIDYLFYMWSYKNPIIVEYKSEPNEEIKNDYIHGFQVGVGLDFIFWTNHANSISFSPSVGLSLFSSQTVKGFENDILSHLYIDLNIRHFLHFDRMGGLRPSEKVK